MRFFKKLLTSLTLVSLVFYGFGGALLLPQTVLAAVTADGPYELIPPSGMHMPANSFDAPLLRFALTQSAGETLSSVAVTIVNNTGGAVTNNTLADHIGSLAVFKDSNSNGNFDPGTDLLAGQTTFTKVATSTNVISTGSNNTLAASGNLATSFFVMFRTGSGWTGADSFKVNMAANGIATSANSPTITAFTGANAVDAQTQSGGGMGGFAVQRATFINATTVDITFTDDLDLNSGAATTTGNYTLSGTGNSAVTNVTVLPDNRSVRAIAGGAALVSDGNSKIAVSANVKNKFGIANGFTAPNPLFSGFQPLVISEVKAGASSDQYDEFIEIYNRSANDFLATSTLRLHVVNAAGTADIAVPLTWLARGGVGVKVPANGYLLIAPITSPASSTADAVYATSSVSIVPDGAVYISNSAASSTAVIDKVCWGSHAVPGNCEGPAVSALLNNGSSIERKANNSSTAATMAGGADATNGNGQDTSNNSFDFVTRVTPEPQNNLSTTETPGGGSFGGSGNQAPNIQHAPIFRATTSTVFSLVARLTDDGGELSSDKTQLIFCTDDAGTCAPVSSTPIFGTSIGSGWFKFSSSSLSWSNNKTKFRYYLQATDNATPAKTKVFTSDPNFDSVTFDTTTNGIQTSALQQSKALTLSLAQGNLGAASLSGVVKDQSAAAISGATVWIDGTQFSATTGSDGTFSFSNVGPSGGIQLKIAKQGYADQSLSMFVPSSGLVSLPTITLFSGTMGQGGDFNGPKIMGTNPNPGNNNFPIKDPNGAAPPITVNFSKAMDATTITTADATQSGAKIYLTTAGSNTKIAGSVAATNNNMTAVFTPSSVLTAGQGYTLFVTPGVKDTAGNPVMGNGPGGVYSLQFFTSAQFFSNVSDIGGGGFTFGQGNAFPPFVQGSQPATGKVNVARNSKAFVSFSEAMKSGSENLSNVKLYAVTNANQSNESKILVATTNSLDTSGKIVILTPSATLNASATYRIIVTGGIQSSKGIPLGNPGQVGFAGTEFYKADFTTGSSSDTTAPTVNGTIPAASATGISPTQPITISFSEAVNPSTVTNSSLTLNLGSTSISGQLNYDPNTWKATFVPDYSLTATTTYTITVSTDVQDLAGNALDQDSVTASAQSLQRSFTTGSADTAKPTMVSAQGNDFALKITYSKPMLAVGASDLNYSSSVLNPANYLIKVVNSSGVTQSTVNLPGTATITYDPSTRSVVVNGLPTISGFTANSTLLNIKASNVKDIGFNDLDAAANAATSTAKSSAETGGFTGGMAMPMKDAAGNFIQGGGLGGPPPVVSGFSDGGIGFIPQPKVFPFNAQAGATSIYGVDLPLSKQIPATGFIDITFPDGVDVSGARKDPNSPKNTDLNGPGTGVVVFGTSEGTLPTGWATGGQASDGVIVNATSRTVRVILGAVATGSSFDFLHFDIADIINSTIADNVDNGGSTATLETKKADGTVLETRTSGSFVTRAAGSNTVRGRVLVGGSGLNAATVFLFSPMTGRSSSTTANNRFGGADGEFMFQNVAEGQYMLGVEQDFKAGGTRYSAGPPTPLAVDSTNCAATICSRNISILDASTGVTVTLNISGSFSAGGDEVDIFASGPPSAGGPPSFRMVTSTLTGTLTNNTANSVKLNTNGKWFVGFGPAMKGGMFNQTGPVTPPTWVVPRPQEVNVTGCDNNGNNCIATPSVLTFSSVAADKTVKFTVKDSAANKLGQAFVFAYSPNGLGNGGAAGADGTGSLNLSNGTYKIGASIPGMPMGIERTLDLKTVSGVDKVFIDGSATGIALSAMVNSDLVLTVSKPSYTISGKVTDGTNPIANAPVNAFRSDGQGHADTFTNSSGEYTLYVNNGTWKVSAFAPGQYGKLPEKTIVISGASASSQNFEPNTSSVNYATITKDIGADTDADGIFDGGEGLSNVQVTVEGTLTDGSHYLNTVVTDTNGSSTLKVPPGTFTMKAYSPTVGELPAFDSSLVVNSSGVAATNPTNLLAPKTGTVNINILDADGNATTTDKMVVEFQQIGGKTDNVAAFSSVSSTALNLPVYDAGAANIALGNVTSTNPANFYLLKISSPGIAANALNVFGGGSTVLATSTAVSGLFKVEVDGTETINIRLPAVNYMNGVVKDENGAAVPNATVHIENKSTGETTEIKTDSSGAYTAKLSTGSYLVQGQKDGYLDTATTVSVSASGTLAAALTTMTAANRTISGTVSAGGSAVSGATVRGQMLGGGVVTATTGADGTYSLDVMPGDWKVSASADGYVEKSYTTVVTVGGSAVTGIAIALTTANTSLADTQSTSLTPQTGGTLTDTNANLTVKAPGSALSSSANSFSLSGKETSNVVGGGAGKPIGGEAKSITSYNSDGNLVTTLNNNIAIGASYSTTDLTNSLGTLSLAKLEKVKMSSWDSTTDNWENLATTIAYKNASGNFVEPSADLSNVSSVAYTGQTVHLSVFNPTADADGLAPSAPTGVNATPGNGQVAVSWTASATNADDSALTDLLGYEIYRSTSQNGTYTQLNTTDISGTTYTDTNASNGTTYYYKVTAADTGGAESSFSIASTGVAPASTSANSFSTGAGGGGGGPATVTSPILSTPAVSLAEASASSTVSSYTVKLNLSATNVTQVMMSESQIFAGGLWENYASQKSFILSMGNGAKKVYVKFRSAYGVESPVQTVELMLATTEAAPPVSANVKTPINVIIPDTSANEVSKKTTPPPSAYYQFNKTLKPGVSGSDVQQLQRALQSLGFLDAKIKANGIFGPATTAALTRFQASKGIKKEVGLGVKTMAALNALHVLSVNEAPAIKIKEITAPEPIKTPPTKNTSVILKSGMKGQEILALQKILQGLGFLPKSTVANGVFGPATLKAVQAYQKKNKIMPVNGQVGPMTRSALGL